MTEPSERRDDWRRGVDENLAAINEGRRVTEREINRLWKAFSDDDKLLRGDKEKDTDGMIARLHSVENEMNLLKAVLLKDKAGNKGLVGRVEALEGEEKKTVERWKFWAAVLGLIGAITVAIITNLDKIETFVNRRPAPDPLHRAIERAKRPRGRPVVRYRVIQKEPEVAPEPEVEPAE